MHIRWSVINVVFPELHMRTLMPKCFSQLPTFHGWFSETVSGCKSYNSASRSSSAHFADRTSVSFASESLPELCPLVVASPLIWQSIWWRIRSPSSLLRLTLQAHARFVLGLLPVLFMIFKLTSTSRAIVTFSNEPPSSKTGLSYQVGNWSALRFVFQVVPVSLFYGSYNYSHTQRYHGLFGLPNISNCWCGERNSMNIFHPNSFTLAFNGNVESVTFAWFINVQLYTEEHRSSHACQQIKQHSINFIVTEISWFHIVVFSYSLRWNVG